MKLVVMMVHPKLHPARKSQAKSAERAVWSALRGLGYEVEVLPLLESPLKLERELSRRLPYAVFNMLEEFRDEAVYDFHLPAYLEARGIPCTGCNPRGLVISRNKYLVSQLAVATDIPVPTMAISGAQTYRGKFPAFVKYNREHASRGIRASNRVRNPVEMKRTVERMKRSYDGEILLQEFVEGTDVTVSVLGNHRVRAFVPWKLRRKSSADFSTERVKFNAKFRFERGIRAGRYSGPLVKPLLQAAKKIYREADLSGYARMDFRVSSDSFHLVDVNANPNLEMNEDFACSAKFSGWSYVELVEEIIRLARSYRPRI
jgi:D-alanine-D-alanine ligase